MIQEAIQAVEGIAKLLKASPERKMKRAIKKAQNDLDDRREDAMEDGTYEDMKESFAKVQNQIDDQRNRYFGMLGNNID